MVKKLAFLSCLALLLLGLVGPSAGRGATLDIRVASDNEDVEEYVASQNMSLTSSDLEMPYEDTFSPDKEQVIGIRWPVPLAPGTKISKAYVEFTFDEVEVQGAVNLIIEGQLAPNAAAFTSAKADLTSRTRTAAQVKWSPAAWSTAGEKRQTPDLSAILQEIIDQPGWASGNALVVIIRDDKSNPSKGTLAAAARPTSGPVLHIEALVP